MYSFKTCLFDILKLKTNYKLLTMCFRFSKKIIKFLKKKKKLYKKYKKTYLKKRITYKMICFDIYLGKRY